MHSLLPFERDGRQHSGRPRRLPRPMLAAVAIGASIDFLTPFGRHNNRLVMGLAGYSFADFLKAGLAMTLVAEMMALAFLAL